MGETDPSRVLNDFELKAKEFLSAQVKIKGRPRSQVQRDRRWSVGQEFSSLRWKAGFEHYLAVAIQKKNVPLVVVTNRDKAEFEISGGAETEKAGWAKILLWGPLHQRNKQASRL